MSVLYLVDGFNFLHAVVLAGRDRTHWWSRENQGAVRDWIASRPIPDACTWIIFDQREPESGAGGAELVAANEASSGPELRHAPDADAYILARCDELCSSRDVVVVSADRSLVDRAKRRGARALSPWAFARYAGARQGDEPSARDEP